MPWGTVNARSGRTFHQRAIGLAAGWLIVSAALTGAAPATAEPTAPGPTSSTDAPPSSGPSDTPTGSPSSGVPNSASPSGDPSGSGQSPTSRPGNLADLEVTLSTLRAGDTAVRITVINHGPATALDTHLSGSLSEGTSILELLPPGGDWNCGSSAAAGTFDCSSPDVPVGHATLWLTLRGPAAAVTRVEVRADNRDTGHPEDDTATATPSAAPASAVPVQSEPAVPVPSRSSGRPTISPDTIPMSAALTGLDTAVQDVASPASGLPPAAPAQSALSLGGGPDTGGNLPLGMLLISVGLMIGFPALRRL